MYTQNIFTYSNIPLKLSYFFKDIIWFAGEYVYFTCYDNYYLNLNFLNFPILNFL